MSVSSLDKKLDSKVVAYNYGVNSQRTYSFDITEVVGDWREGDTNSMGRGIVFVSADESQVIHKTFGSYNRASYNPVFEMTYLCYNENSFSEQDYDGMVNIAKFTYPQSDFPETKFNCLGMALKNVSLIQYAQLGIVNDSDKRDVDKVADAIVSYAKSSKCNYIVNAEKVGNSLSASRRLLSNKQYFVAVRVMENSAYVKDFHIIAQTNTGTWINKHGQQPIEHLGYINPDITKQACWYSSSDGYWYDSETVYIILTRE